MRRTFWSISALAGELGVAESTIRTWIRSRGLKAKRLPKAVIVTSTDLAEWMKDREPGTRPGAAA